MVKVIDKLAMEELYEERAAILEFDANLSRKEAEARARTEVVEMFMFNQE